MRNILITGINGFLGSQCARYFHNKGYHVVGLVRDINIKTQPDIHKFCSIVRGDVLDKNLVQSVMSKYEIQDILHLAAQPIVRICNEDPYSAYMTNVVGTLNVLESARLFKKIEKIIVISSDKAYGPAEKLPYREDSPLTIADSYCTSKACQDQIARSYAITYKMPIVTVRAGNLYGPGDMNLSRLIPGSILKLLNGQAPFLYTGVANYIREFIYVNNVADAFKILLDKGVPGEAYNIGGTKPYKILDVIEMIRDKINPSQGIELAPKEFYEIPEQYLDATKLMNLGWKPETDLSTGLDNAIVWYRNYLQSQANAII